MGFLNKKSRRGASNEYWRSYSDMMAAMLLVFILLMSYTAAQSLKSIEQNEEKQRELQAQQAKLDEQQTKLDEQQTKLDEQQQMIDEQKMLLDKQNKQIEAIIGVKSAIIQALSNAFRESNLKVDIDQKTGSIRLDSNILFAVDSSELSYAGKQFLRSFLPMYMSVLFDQKYRKYISEIIIEGHTDDDGPYMYNLSLSQKRAHSVAAYWINEIKTNMPTEDQVAIRSLITANGRSFSNLIKDENGEVDKGKSRRVEIRFRMNDEETIENLKILLDASLSH